MSFGRFVLGAIVGGALGTLAGMSLAPRSGEETRRLIQDELDSRIKNTQDTADTVKSKVKDAVQEKSQALKEKAESIKEQALALSHELEETGRRTMARFGADAAHDAKPSNS
ncbi:MAG: YtxH domain-containing protein [Cyanobacteria bacterium]|nr:YtxH domain-containing protein [Cyanobacteriota bacterium]